MSSTAEAPTGSSENENENGISLSQKPPSHKKKRKRSNSINSSNRGHAFYSPLSPINLSSPPPTAPSPIERRSPPRRNTRRVRRSHYESDAMMELEKRVIYVFNKKLIPLMDEMDTVKTTDADFNIYYNLIENMVEVLKETQPLFIHPPSPPTGPRRKTRRTN